MLQPDDREPEARERETTGLMSSVRSDRVIGAKL